MMHLPRHLVIFANFATHCFSAVVPLHSLIKRDNIKDFVGCNSTQRSMIQEAYKDALALATYASPFARCHDELSVEPDPPVSPTFVNLGTNALAVRFFGEVCPHNCKSGRSCFIRGQWFHAT